MNIIATITLGAMLSLSKPVSLAPSPESKATVSTEATTSPVKTEMTYQQILDLSPKSLEALTGKHLSFKEKMGLNILKHDIKSKIKAKEIAASDTVNINAALAGENTSVNIIGLLAGLLLGLIGVLLVYIFSSDPVMRRSSWYGWGIWLVILLISLM